MLRIPTLEVAEKYMQQAAGLNPGSWIEHSRFVARGAGLIAEKCNDIDSEAAYILGLLHDIGRREGKTQARHSIDGYNFLIDEGYEDSARICMTHTFQYKDVRAIYDNWDCSADELQVIEQYLSNIEYNQYDLLIQLSDALSTDTGFCCLEKKMVNSAIKFGVKDILAKKWESTLKIKEYFEDQTKCSIYCLIPTILE